MLLRCPQLPGFLIFLNVKLLKSWWTALCPSSKLHRPCRLLHVAITVSLYNHMQKPGSEGQFLLLTVREAQPNQCPSCVLGLLGLLWRISPIPMAFVCNCMLITQVPVFSPDIYRAPDLDIPLLDEQILHTDLIIFPSKSALLVFFSWYMAPPSTDQNTGIISFSLLSPQTSLLVIQEVYTLSWCIM